MLGVDALGVLTLFVLVGALQPAGWLLIIACAVTATLPDFVWLPYWLAELAGKRKQSDPLDPFSTLHRRIQWGERPWGMRIELPWTVVTATILVWLVRRYGA
jgi:hypothetical protein